MPDLSDTQVAASLGMEYTGERDQDQMVQDAVEGLEAARAEGTLRQPKRLRSALSSLKTQWRAWRRPRYARAMVWQT